MQDQKYNPTNNELEAIRSKMIINTDDVMNDFPIENNSFRVIGQIPKQNEKIYVNGLIFDVISSDNLKGRFVAKLSKLNDEDS